MAKTIKIIQRYSYGIVTCIECRETQTFNAINTKTNKPCDICMYSLRRFASAAGWTQNKRHQWVCPKCSNQEVK